MLWIRALPAGLKHLGRLAGMEILPPLGVSDVGQEPDGAEMEGEVGQIVGAEGDHGLDESNQARAFFDDADALNGGNYAINACFKQDEIAISRKPGLLGRRSLFLF
jgi:hypothetical protein